MGTRKCMALGCRRGSAWTPRPEAPSPKGLKLVAQTPPASAARAHRRRPLLRRRSPSDVACARCTPRGPSLSASAFGSSPARKAPKVPRKAAFGVDEPHLFPDSFRRIRMDEEAPFSCFLEATWMGQMNVVRDCSSVGDGLV